MEKKKVLYFVPEFPRISETFIEREISTLIEMGSLDINILSLAKANGSTSNEVMHKVHYKRLDFLNALGGSFYLFTKTKKVLKAYRQVGSLGLFQFVKFLGYTKIIEAFKPQHIHVHFFSWPSTMAMVSSIILDLPYSISGHARDVFMEGEFIPAKIKSAKFVCICNSFAYKKALEMAGKNVDTSEVKLIYHGVDSKMFEEAPKTEKLSVPTIFLGGTRLVEKKGLKYMIEASKILVDKGIAHKVDLVGPGPLYNELLDQIKQLGLQNTVYIHGGGEGTPFAEVLNYYKIADVFVLPSIETGSGDADGVPTVVIEAAMAKLPIVSTNAGGITDLIEDGVTGLVVEQRNSEDIAAAINLLLSDKELAKNLAQNAYYKAVKMFDIKKNVGELEKMLNG